MLNQNNKPSLKIEKMGILGGGQLAFLLAKAAFEKGLAVHVYAQDIDEPACSIATKTTIGSKENFELLKEFFSACDIVTLESEFFLPSVLNELESQTEVKVYPSLSAYESLYSKENQKKFFDKFEIPVVNYTKILNEKDLNELNFDGPYMLKLSSGGYDGYGNFLAHDREQLVRKIKELSPKWDKIFIVEQFIKIKNEFAAILFKGFDTTLILPPCQSYQEDSICKLVKYPANMDDQKEHALMSIMQKIDRALIGQGVFAFEFFETTKGEILVNEAAPRVHNSYHFSIEAFDHNQFDLFLDSILGHKLYHPKQCYSYVSMVNILGQSSGENYELKIPELSGDFKYNVHMYGKKINKPGRKMGHVTLYGESENFCFAEKINKEYIL